MRIKWNFWYERSEDFSDKPALCPKSIWKPAHSHLGLELFLSQIEEDIFEHLVKDSIPINLNMTKEEWDNLRGPSDERSIVIKKADKGSCVVVWCRDDCIKEAGNQLRYNTAYKDVNFKDTMPSDLRDKSNKFFKSLHSRKCITEKEIKYFSIQFKKKIQPRQVIWFAKSL